MPPVPVTRFSISAFWGFASVILILSNDLRQSLMTTKSNRRHAGQNHIWGFNKYWNASGFVFFWKESFKDNFSYSHQVQHRVFSRLHGGN
jgi:hypothetical protein